MYITGLLDIARMYVFMYVCNRSLGYRTSAGSLPWPPHLSSKEAEVEAVARGTALPVLKSAEKCSPYTEFLQ